LSKVVHRHRIIAGQRLDPYDLDASGMESVIIRLVADVPHLLEREDRILNSVRGRRIREQNRVVGRVNELDGCAA
jgi:hypothetical protein